MKSKSVPDVILGGIFFDAKGRPVSPVYSPDHDSSFWICLEPEPDYSCCPALTGRTWRGNPPGYDKSYETAQLESWKSARRSSPEIMFEEHDP